MRQLGRTLKRWGPQIAARHRSRASNGPVEAINNLTKTVKRVAFGITNWTHWRVRVLLYAGKPDGSKSSPPSPRPPRELPRSQKTKYDESALRAEVSRVGGRGKRRSTPQQGAR
ncbi:MAG: transposase [Dehalococcoidia bacterium]